MSGVAYLTPGPSQPHPRLREFLDDAWEADVMALSHRGTDFVDIYQRTAAALRELLDIPPDYRIMFMGSATEAMERITQGVVAGRSHHFVNGAFSEKWFEIAKQLGKDPTATRAEGGKAFTKKDLAAVPADAELLCITQNETSTGLAFPEADLLQLTRLPGRPLVALDVVSSAPLSVLPWKKLDLVFFSVQKAFGLPAGLGVLITSPRALAAADKLQEQGLSLGSYHSLPRLAADADKFQTPETPNVLGIYLLGRVAEDFLVRGIITLRRETQDRARRLYDALEAHDHIEPFVRDTRWRSPIVAVVTVHNGNEALRKTLRTQGLEPGLGYKPFEAQHLRIANFPATDAQTFDTMLTHLQRYKL